MPGSGGRSVVPTAVVLAILSTVSGLVTTFVSAGHGRAEADTRYLVPRDELERRLGSIERRIDVKFFELRELIIRRTSK